MSKHVLTVDDSSAIRFRITQLLRDKDYDVLEAENGLKALDILKSHQIELLITDLHMPEMDGLELIEEVRKMTQYKYLPILFLTTETADDIIAKGKRAGATGWIVKPFQPDKLLRSIKRVL